MKQQKDEAEKAKPVLVRLVWTEAGAEKGAFSEQGRAQAGAEFETDAPDLFVSRGWAEPVAK